MHEPSPDAPSLAAYADVTDRDRIEQLRALAAALEDTHILHVNSAAAGGGVAELLRSIVPLSNDLGIETDWLVMDADSAFFEVTKALHNGLQGEGARLTDEMKATYTSVVEQNAAAIDADYDVIVLHDPQPLGMIDVLTDRMPTVPVIWRCHIDLTDPSSEHLSFVTAYAQAVDHAVFSRHTYEDAIDLPLSSVVHPSIDPLSAKNRTLDDVTVETERDRLAPLSFDAPLVTQVSRFDPWKDQFGTLEAYRRVVDDHPDAQLALVGGMADDDPEGEAIYEQVAAEAADDPNVYVLTDLPDETVNLLQRRSDVVVQKSLREGFGLVVSEALWKRTPVVGSTAGGIPLQIENDKGGYLVDPTDVAGTADRIERLLEDNDHRRTLGQNGHEHVRAQFLLPRQLAEYLEVVASLVDGS